MIRTKNKQLKVFTFAKFQAILFIFIGALAGILYSIGGLIHDLLNTGLNSGTALAFLAIIGMPILFGIGGFFTGIIEALIFNGSLKLLSGVDTEIFEKQE